MSVQAISWVWERSAQSGSALLALLAIANHANSEGKNAFPSIQTLADECRMSKRAMKYIVAKIPTSELKVRSRASSRGCNVYELPGVVRDGFHIPGRRRGANFAPSDNKTVGQSSAEVGQDSTKTGAIAVAPEPSLFVREPSPRRNPAAAQRGDPRHQPFVKFAHELFAGKRGQKPTWGRGQYTQLRDLLKCAETASLADLQRRFSNYLASTDDFIVRNGYSLSIFCQRFDALGDGPIFQKGGTGNGNGKLSGANLDTQILQTAATAGRPN